MSRHSVVEAKNQLSDLIDRALKGEDVVITRHGQPVVELKRVEATPKPVTREALDWLDDNRVGGRMPKQDAAALIRKMRDER